MSEHDDRVPHADEQPETLTVPVFLNFDVQLCVGQLTLAKSALPPTPDFAFRIAYTQSKTGGPYEVRSVGLVPDWFGLLPPSKRAPDAGNAGT